MKAKNKRNRIFVMLLILVFVCTGMSGAFAVDSITKRDVQPSVVTPSDNGNGTTNNGTTDNNTGANVVTEIDTSRYSNETVKQVVSDTNEEIAFYEEVFDDLNNDLEKAMEELEESLKEYSKTAEEVDKAMNESTKPVETILQMVEEAGLSVQEPQVLTEVVAITREYKDITDTDIAKFAESSGKSKENVSAIVEVVAAVNNDVTAISTPAMTVIKMQDQQPAGKTNPTQMTTTNGKTINTMVYDSLTEFMDLGYQTGNNVSLDGTPGTVTIEVPQAIGKKGKDLMIMQIHPTTGEISLIPVTAFDSETGQLTAEFANYGPFSVISKLPIVNKTVSTEKYPNQDIANEINSISTTSYIDFDEWRSARGLNDRTFSFEYTTKDSSNNEKKEKKTINVDEYVAVTQITDTAVRYGDQSYSYNMSTKIQANLYQDLDRSNWTGVLKAAGINYSVSEIKKNPQLLKNIEPFVLKDAFVYHVDAVTGEESIIYEPTIYFDTYDEAIGDTVQLQDGQDSGEETSSLIDVDDIFNHSVFAEMEAVDQDDFTRFDCDDIDEDNTANLNMVISGDGYIGLGPFALFMTKKSVSESLWWLWILIAIILILLIAIVIYYVRSKKKTA